ERLRRARVLLWKGYCHVHTHFSVADVERARERWPGVKVLVHLECTEEVVNAADVAGSTSLMCRIVEEAAPGSTFAIGTEINMIHRLAYDHPDKEVHTLSRSLCPNMYRINLYNLHDLLRDLDRAEPVHLPEEVRRDGRLALDRMLAVP
ncbi:MAG: quinolinate synthase NadA, partial [Planctomycetota bacterium]